MKPPTKPRRSWREACVCGGSILVRELPVDRATWTPVDWEAIAEAVRWHRRQPAHVAWQLGYRVRETVAWTTDALPILELR